MHILRSRFTSTRVFLFLLCLGLPAAFAAQPPEITFSALLSSVSYSPNATNSSVIVNGSVCDAAGNVYVTGAFEGTITNGTNVLPNSGGFANPDVYVAKYDPAGNIIWIRRAGGSGKDSGQAIALDGAGGVYVSGTSDSYPFTIGTNSFNNINKGMFLARYDAAGNVTWARWGGAPGIFVSAFMSITSLAQDAAGNPIVAGSFRGSPVIGNGTNSISLTNKADASLANAYDDMFLAKFSTSGSLLWATNHGGTNSEVANSIAVDSAGAIYVAGTYQLNTVFGAQIYTNLTEGVLLVKLAADGSLIWSSNLSDATNSNPGRGLSIGVDSADRITMSLQGDNSAKPFVYQGNSFVLSQGNISLLARFDTSGNLAWIRHTIFNGVQSRVTFDQQDNLYLSSPGGLTNGSIAPGSLSVLKSDFNGQPIWTNHIPTSGTSLSLPFISVDAAGVTHVATTLGAGQPLTVGWTNLIFSLGGQHQLTFTIAANFVAVPPVILTQPTNMFFQPPQGLTNLVQARAWPAPNYYWYQHSVRIPNATNFQFTLAPTTFTNRTDYFVVASNAYGTVTSTVVSATAGIAFVTQPPTNISILNGSTLTISAIATGTTAINYQWRINGTNITNGTGVPLVLSNIASNQAGNYTLVISNATGALTSAPVTVVKVLPFGAVDPAFTNFGIGAALSLFRVPDGSFYAANGINVGHVNPDGTVDTNFVNIQTRAYRWNDGSGSDNFLGPTFIQPEPDGQLLIGGLFKVYYPTPLTATNVNRLVRLSTSGVLDTNFNVGTGATNTSDGQSFSKVESVIRLTNGQYLVAGTFNKFNGVAKSNLVRLNQNGSLDNTFPAQTVRYANGSSAVASIHKIVLDAQGRIVIVGEFDLFDGVPNHCLTRLNGDGTVDPNFIQTSIPAPNFGRVNNVLPLADGKILVAGAWNNNQTNIGVMRFNSDGSKDTNWAGKMPGEAYSLSLMPNSKLIIGGNAYIRRTTYDGFNDPVFDPGTAFASAQTYAIVQEPSGNLMLGGSPYGMRRLLLEPAVVVLPVFGGGSGTAFVNGHFQFSACGGVDGQTVIVQSTTNLVDWVNVSTNLVVGGCVSYTDPRSPAPANSFYRLAAP